MKSTLEDPRDGLAPDEERIEPPSLHHLLRVLRTYRYAILAIVAAALLLYTIGAVLYLLRAPTEQIVSLPFRFDFDAAEQGMYPNGAKFAYTDVVASGVLTTVYQNNHLDRFVTFPEFSRSLFILESNPTLAAIDREFTARLSDPRLTSVDRERIEKEYEQRRNSASHSEYALNLVRTRTKIPTDTAAKVLGDVLDAWARDAVTEKGALRIAAFGRVDAALPDATLPPFNEPLTTLEMIRSRIHDTQAVLQTSVTDPTAPVLRSGRHDVSISDVLKRLADLDRFRISVIRARILHNGLLRDRAETMAFLEAQRDYTARQVDELTSVRDALQNGLQMYDATIAGSSAATTSAAPRSAEPAAGETRETVMPQLSETFLDRLVTMANATANKEYRQKMTDQVTKIETRTAPLLAEKAYYAATIDALSRQTAVRTPTADEDRALRQDLAQVTDSFAQTMRDARAVYDILSGARTAPKNLYSITGPSTSHRETGTSFVRLLLGGVLAVLCAIPVALVLVILHYRFRREETDDAAGNAAAAAV